MQYLHGTVKQWEFCLLTFWLYHLPSLDFWLVMGGREALEACAPPWPVTTGGKPGCSLIIPLLRKLLFLLLCLHENPLWINQSRWCNGTVYPYCNDKDLLMRIIVGVQGRGTSKYGNFCRKWRVVRKSINKRNSVETWKQTISMKIKLFIQTQSQEKGEFTFRESPSALFDLVTNASFSGLGIIVIGTEHIGVSMLLLYSRVIC